MTKVWCVLRVNVAGEKLIGVFSSKDLAWSAISNKEREEDELRCVNISYSRRYNRLLGTRESVTLLNEWRRWVKEAGFSDEILNVIDCYYTVREVTIDS